MLDERMKELAELPESEVIRRTIAIEKLLKHDLTEVHKRLFVAEGPIGVGKSTLVELFASRCNMKAFLEDVDNNPTWEDIITQFYVNRTVYGFSTQVALMHVRRGIYRRAFNYPNSALVDRTVWGDRFVFVPTLVDQGLPQSDVNKLEEEYKKFESQFPPIDLMLLLTSKPETAYQRYSQRGRAMEMNTDLVEKLSPDHYIVKICQRCNALPDTLKEKELYDGPVVRIDQDTFRLTDGRHMTALLEEIAVSLEIKKYREI